MVVVFLLLYNTEEVGKYECCLQCLAASHNVIINAHNSAAACKPAEWWWGWRIPRFRWWRALCKFWWLGKWLEMIRQPCSLLYVSWSVNQHWWWWRGCYTCKCNQVITHGGPLYATLYPSWRLLYRAWILYAICYMLYATLYPSW